MIKVNYILSVFLARMNQHVGTKLTSWLNWSQTSPDTLEACESKLFSFLKNPVKGYFVNIGKGWFLDDNNIWTIELGPSTVRSETDSRRDNERLPVILMHGFGAGSAIWIQNLDALCETRKVYAFDILGFARSSRPYFDYSGDVERQLAESIEKWRSTLGIDGKIILLGHSFGAYLAISYALRFPDKVAHLILADPWGIPAQQQNGKSMGSFTLPYWVRGVGYILSFFKPFFALRAAGPWGLSLIKKVRPDLKKKFEPVLGAKDSDLILEYLYHCNVQPNPSGEGAFKALSLPRGWAKYPMIHRIKDLRLDITLTLIQGARSWVDREQINGVKIKCVLGDHRVSLHVIQGAGHHVYADKPDEFNNIVNTACNIADLHFNQRQRIST